MRSNSFDRREVTKIKQTVKHSVALHFSTAADGDDCYRSSNSAVDLAFVYIESMKRKEFCFASRMQHISLHKHVIWSRDVIRHKCNDKRCLTLINEMEENSRANAAADNCKIKYLIRRINNDAHHHYSPSRVTQHRANEQASERLQHTQTHGELYSSVLRLITHNRRSFEATRL